MTFKMVQDDYYGKVILPAEIFNNLKEEYFISHSTDTVKYMCANLEEGEYLETLGVDLCGDNSHADFVSCDWFKIVKEYKRPHDERGWQPK